MVVYKHILCSVDVHKAIKLLSVERGVSMSDVIRDLLDGVSS